MIAWWTEKGEKSTGWFARIACAIGIGREGGRWATRTGLLSISILILLSLICPQARSQAGNAAALWGGPIATPYGPPASNAPLRVCLPSSVGSPCSTAGVSLFADPNLTQPLQNPTTLNGQGYYSIFTNASGMYEVQIQVSGVSLPYTYFQWTGTTASGGCSAGTCVLTNPTGPQTIRQPTGTSLNLVGGPLDVGTLPTYSVQIAPLGTMTASWNFDTTTPATALASLGGTSLTNAVVKNPTGSQGIAQPTGTQFYSNIIDGDYIAQWFQTPANTGNNGIANSVAIANPSGAGGYSIADPSYSSTETIAGVGGGSYGGPGNYVPIPGWEPNTHVSDFRGGHDQEVFTRGGSAQFTVIPAFSVNYFDTYDVTGPTLAMQGEMFLNDFYGVGQQINGFGGVNLKSYSTGTTFNYQAKNAGQHLGITTNMYSMGVGDAVGITNQVTCAGGASTYNDVGCHLKENSVSEDSVVFHGTITAVNTGSIQTNPTSGAGDQGDLRYVADETTGVVHGTGYPNQYLSNYGDGFPPSPTIWGANGQVPNDATFVGTSFTPSILMMICTTQFGGSCPNTSTTNPSGQIMSAPNGYAPGTLTVNLVTVAPGLPNAYALTTSGVTAGEVCTVADQQYYETAVVTAVPSSTSLTIAFNYPHFNGATVSCGGSPSGQTGLEITGDTVTSGGVTFRQVYPVVGSLDATDLLVWTHDPQQNWGGVTNANGQAYCQTDPIAITGTSGNTVTYVDTTTNVPWNPHFAGGAVVTYSTANSSYNGAFATTAISIYYSGNENYPAYQYTATALSGTQPTTGTATICNTNFNIYPMVQAMNVLNPATHTIDGYFQLAPYSIASFLVGDTVSEPHYFWQYVNQSVAPDGVTQYTKQPFYNSVATSGLTYGPTASASRIGFGITNFSPTSFYAGYGGTAAAPDTAYYISGEWQHFLESYYPPMAGSAGAILNVMNCDPVYGCGNSTLSPFKIYNNSASNAELWDDVPAGAIVSGNALGVSGGGGGPTFGSFPQFMYSPQFGTIGFSKDNSNTRNPDSLVEGNGFQFWSTFTPPTNYEHVQMYGDSGTSVGMQFLCSACGSVSTYQGGQFNLGSLGLYLPGTTTAALNAGISTTSTANEIDMNGATGTRTANVYASTFNGVGLTTADSTSVFLNGAGGYTTPAGSSLPSGAVDQLLYYATAGTTVTPLTLGTNLSITSGTLNAAGGSSTNGAQTWLALNYSTGGTSLNHMACWDNQTNDTNGVVTCPTASTNLGTNANPGYAGVVTAGAGTTGLATVQYQGSVQWDCDNVVGVGDWVQVSWTAAGECHDAIISGGANSQQLNENPESNWAVGVVLTANTAVGGAATIVLMPHFGYVQNVADLPSPLASGQSFPLTTVGSPFTSASYWTQNASTASGANGSSMALTGNHAIDLWNNNGFFEINPGTSGLGASNRDIVFDVLSHGYGSPPNEEFRFNGGIYVVPAIQSITGTVSLTMNNTAGLFIWTLTGNSTLSNSTLTTSESVGHISTFDIVQNGTTAYTFTWPSNFIGAPTVSTVLGSSTVARFLYDGTNYECVSGCAGDVSFIASVAGTNLLTAGGINFLNTGHQISFSNPSGLNLSGDINGVLPASTLPTDVAYYDATAPAFTNPVTIQGFKAVTSQDQQNRTYSSATDTGTANAYAVSLTPAPTLGKYTQFSFIAANTNTGASTISINGTVVNLTKKGATALVSGDILATGYYQVGYDGTEAQLLNPSETSITATTVTATSSVTTPLINGASISWFGSGNANVGGQLPSASTGSDNTATGNAALESNTTGSTNTAYGQGALFENTTGSFNIAIGPGTLEHNTSGYNNIAIGPTGALETNTTSHDNVAIGLNSLAANTSGANNVAVGNGSLTSITTGYSDTAMGNGAGQYISGGSTVNATSSESIYLGMSTMALASGDTNEIVIGYGATGNGSNTTTIGDSSTTDTYLQGNVHATNSVTTPHVVASGSGVTLSGTGGTPTCVSSTTCLDWRGRISVPSATTSSVVTFATAYATSPVCTVTQNGGATFFIPAWSSTTTALTITTGVALTAAEEFDYTCIQ